MKNKLFDNNMEFISTLTIGELAAAYEVPLNRISDLQFIFNLVSEDITSEGFRLLYGNSWKKTEE